MGPGSARCALARDDNVVVSNHASPSSNLIASALSRLV